MTKILILDNEIHLDLEEKLLKHINENFSIFKANTCNEAFKFIQNNTINLLFCELYISNQPENQIIKLLEKIDNKNNLKIIGTTGNLYPDYYREIFDFILQKPYTLVDLKEALRKVGIK